ncbi:MAG: FxsA family protein [Myxococcales bacterium]|jgi:UPF0716 protein FxsA
MGKLFLLFTIVPLVELYLLTWLAGRVGFWTTVMIVLVTGVLGAAMARAEGLRVIRSWQRSIEQGQLPEEGVMGGVLVLVGGVLLVTPGVLTDALGLSLLFPPTRRLIAIELTRRVQRAIERGSIHVVRHGPGPGPSVHVRRPDGAPSGRGRIGEGEIIDVEGEIVDD